MKNQQTESQPSGLSLTDVYYVIFRHKWKIMCLSAAGFLAAAVIYVEQPPMYSSEAELFIRYVVETKMPTGMGGDPQIKMPSGGNIISTEVEIIKSLDLAEQVVDAVGADRILAKVGGGTNRFLAASLVKKGLTIEVVASSDVLRIVFQHPDQQIVQPVLVQLVSSYRQKSSELHRAMGVFDDVLTAQADGIRSRLAATEEELRKSKMKVGVMSLEDAKKAHTEEISKIREMLFDTEAELAGQQAALKEMQGMQPVKPEPSATDPGIPLEKISLYKSLSSQLERFRKQEQDLLATFTEENDRVKNMRAGIELAESTKRKLEEEYPKLASMGGPKGTTSQAPLDLSPQIAHIKSLEAKYNILRTNYERVLIEASAVNEMEPTIIQLQRKRDLEETQYRHYSSSLDQARFDDALGAGKLSNISIAQSPTPPFRESRQLVKLLAGVIAGGVLSGIALAFLIELCFDRTVKRPIEVETRLHLPVLLTIPDSHKNGRLRLFQGGGKGRKLLKGPPGQAGAAEAANGASAPDSEIAPWDVRHGLRRFHEALRDRLVRNFEIRNLTHKPKLVAVTSCGVGAGVSTIAVGLAATLSEIGEGRVLLVDMNLEHGAAHPFFQGKPTCDLADALENPKRDNALVQENLYVVCEAKNDRHLPRILPRRFSNLVPKLKASDYDYVIFDMPPVHQLSVTSQLAGFMDMVLLVIESEKTDRDAVKRANALLLESNAHVGVVMNKSHTYIPKALHQELLGEI